MTENKQYYVYVTTNLINGKQYVGDHKINLKRREYYIGSGTVFQNAIKKHGHNNFFKEILEWFDTREDSFKTQEKYIKEFNTVLPNGYNISPTGGVGVINFCSDKMRKKIGDGSRGRKQSPETIQKRMKTTKERWGDVKRYASEETKRNLSISHQGPRPWRVGKKLPPHTEEYKQQRRLFRHSEEAKRKIAIAFSKPVVQYDLNGIFIQEFESAIMAAMVMDCSQRNICGAASPNGRQKTAKGFIWKYKNIQND